MFGLGRDRGRRWDPAYRTLKSSGLFDAEFYLKQYPDVAAGGLDPLEHYIRFGAAEGRYPSLQFDPVFYVNNTPAIEAAKQNPLLHYLEEGAKQNLPAQGPQLDDGKQAALDAINGSGAFDRPYYLKENPDVATSGLDGALHYVCYGATENRNPNATFDTAFYRSTYDDVGEENPFFHYIRVGRGERRKTLPPNAAAAHRAAPNPNTAAPRDLIAAWGQSSPIHASIKSVSESWPNAANYIDPKIIAFFLPQYHRIKENDEWWGKGFTEWTNVRKGRPNFVGHYQPHVPLDDNYYDLSDVRVQERQATQAREYGVHAFCYYLYWFNGRRVLEQPLDAMLASKSITQPFCVCWANENWTRTWDGRENDILLAQKHSPESDRQFIIDTMKYLSDPRYLRIDGKLALLVYRADLLKDARRATEIWRDEVRKAGLGELHLCAVQFYGVTDPHDWGFDAAVEFPPHGWLTQENKAPEPPEMLNSKFAGHIFDYDRAIDFALRKPLPDYRWYRGVFPGWDNTARRQDTPHIFADAHPLRFEHWLQSVLRQTVIMSPPEHQFVFINAWNEWGEGAHLEPDLKFGKMNLMAVDSALRQVRAEGTSLAILSRLRSKGAYLGREQDELALLNILKGNEQTLRRLAFDLDAAIARTTGEQRGEIRDLSLG